MPFIHSPSCAHVPVTDRNKYQIWPVTLKTALGPSIAVSEGQTLGADSLRHRDSKFSMKILLVLRSLLVPTIPNTYEFCNAFIYKMIHFQKLSKK